MIKWVVGLLVSSSLVGLLAQCNLSGAVGQNSQPPLPFPPTGPVLRLAFLSPTTGELATFGRALRSGSILAFDEWNNQGGVLARRIEWTIYEADCDFEAAQQAVQQALDDGLDFLIGPLCSEAAIAAAAAVETKGALLIAPTATHPLVTVDGQGRTRPTVFRVSTVFQAQGEAAARFAIESLSIRRAALLIDPHDDYSATLGESFAAELAAQGGQIVYQGNFTPADTDFTPALQAAGAAGAELLYLPTPISVVNRIAGQMSQLRQSGSLRLTLLGSDSWHSADLDRTAAAGSYFTTHFFLDDQQPPTQQWAETYKASYAVAPDTLAFLGYEAATVLLEAVQQAGTLDVESVAKTLAQGHFEGVTGPLTFDPQHNSFRPVPVVQVKDGQLIFAGYVNASNK
ncbi:MAG: ABC transporter substrate-binding protein [Anaerolineae bacterium]|nr:ABC transporter substrate-binding protein [Anaerolineae bacterium]